MLADRVAALSLKQIRSIVSNAQVELRAIRHPWLQCHCIPQRPIGRMQLVVPTPGVTAHVCRVIPGAVVHDRPSDELRPRIVTVAIIVEKICDREPAKCHGVPIYGPAPGKLILIAIKRFTLGAPSEIVLNVCARQIRLRRHARDSGKFTVRIIRNSGDTTESQAARQFRIHVDCGVIAQTQP